MKIDSHDALQQGSPWPIYGQRATCNPWSQFIRPTTEFVLIKLGVMTLSFANVTFFDNLLVTKYVGSLSFVCVLHSTSPTAKTEL